MSGTSRWDRPPGPKDVRWFVRLVGKVLISCGLLMFGFVAYQLWGTGIEYARAQDRAESQFEEMMAAVSTTNGPSSTTPTTRPPATAADPTAPDSTPAGSTSASPTTTALPTTTSAASTSTTTAPTSTTSTVPTYADTIAAMNITEGAPIGFMEVPSLDLGVYLFPGVSRADLENGPGHFPDTPMPGQLGNSALAGHRTTYGQPFRYVDRIEPGDEIVVTMPYGRFVYRMTSSEIVEPSDIDVIATTDPTTAALTLTSCHPVYSASQRYIVYAELDLSQSSAPGQSVLNYGRDEPAPTAVGLPSEDVPVESTAPTTTAPTTTTSVVSTPSTTAAEVVTPPASGQPIATSTTAATTTTEAQPTTAAAPDTLYNVVPVGGLDGAGPIGGGGSTDEAGGSTDDYGEAFSNRWFSDKDALPQVALWALGCAAVVVGAYLLAKRLRNSWIGLAVGIAPFVVGLYYFYENVNRLLPAAI